MKKMTIILLIHLLLCNLFSVVAQQSQPLVVKIIPSQKTNVVMTEVELNAFLFNNSNTTVILFDHRYAEPSWLGFHEEWSCNGKVMDKFMDAPTGNFKTTSFINLEPGDSILVDIKKFNSFTPGKFTFQYQLSAARSGVKLKYASDEQAKELASEITEYNLLSPEINITYESFDIPEDALQDLSLEQLKGRKIFSSLEQAAKSPSQVFILSISNKTINNEWLKGIANFKNLQILNFYNVSGFDSIPENFKNLKFLKELSIKSRNDYIAESLTFSPDFFNLIKLEVLELNNFGIPALSVSFENFTSLKRLTIKKCNLASVDFDLSKLKHLERLDLSRNKLVIMPKIENLPKVSYINLSKNMIDNIPEIINTSSLTSLNLSGNKISSFLESIALIESLTTIDLSQNSLSEFPTNVTKLNNLQLLLLADNKISTLPKEIVTMDKLTNINLNNCGYSTIQPALFQIPKLASIQLKNNGITILPDEFDKLPNLYLLDISENKISELPKSLLSCSRLKKLEVKGNPIKRNGVAKQLEKTNKRMYK